MGRETQVCITIGVPGSGKSTWAKEFVRTNKRWVRVGRDDFRYMYKDVGFDPSIETLVTSAHNAAVRAALRQGYNVIVDNTNCTQKYLNETVKEFRGNASVTFKYFPIELEEAVRRDEGRERSVGREVVERMHASLSQWIGGFGTLVALDRLPPDGSFLTSDDPLLPKAIIVDLDGTLAVMGDRSPYDEARCEVDAVCSPVRKVVERMQRDHTVVLMSGRDEGRGRAATERWLLANGITWDHLLMRPAGDQRKDSIVKRELHDAHVKGKYNVAFAIDDRKAVKEMWVGLGIFVLDVNQHDEIF